LIAIATTTPVQAQAHREPPTRTGPAAFAIIVDAATWTAIPDAIRAYRDAVEADELATWILADEWRDPDAVRDALRGLRKETPGLEGALLVGSVPVAMLRHAQHLTTAFKMDEERYDRRESSVPSDRFYEDFDLVCRPEGRDEKDARLWYYSLAPESTQRIEKEIYTARLWPPGDGDEAHAAIAACLERFAATKRGTERLDRALTLLGHGYLSESLVAWADTRAAFIEQIPALHLPGGALVSLLHSRGIDLERELLRELADPACDVAFLHSHGNDAVQYLRGAPDLPTAKAKVEALQRYLRNRLRRARKGGKDEDELRTGLSQRLGVPETWFEGAFDAKTTQADETAEQLTELEAGEVGTISMGAKVVCLDSCFNGNFVAGPYQAAAYLFGDSKAAVIAAHSVGVAQDIWAERNIGVLAAGGRVGSWHRDCSHLESHLFGDPTFRFARDPQAASAQARVEKIRTTTDDDTLVATLQRDASAVRRLEALALLAQHRSTAFYRALKLAVVDPSEIVRRRAVGLMGDVGNDEFLAPLLAAVLRDPSERVTFRARGALQKFPREAVARALPAALAALPPGATIGDREALLRSVQSSSFLDEYRETATDREKPAAKRVSALRTFRLYRVHTIVPVLIALASAADDEPTVRCAAIEALGWFVYSNRRPMMEAAIAAIAEDAAQPKTVRDEAQKTLNRLRTGANDTLLP